MTALSESAWEHDALDTLAEPLGWRPRTGENIAPGSGERDTWDDLLIRPRLLEALRHLNPGVPGGYLQQAVAEIAYDAVATNGSAVNVQGEAVLAQLARELVTVMGPIRLAPAGAIRLPRRCRDGVDGGALCEHALAEHIVSTRVTVKGLARWSA